MTAPAPPAPPSDSDEMCRVMFCASFNALLSGDEIEDSPIPDKIRGVITHCAGPKGHLGEHVGRMMEDQFAVIWNPLVDECGCSLDWRIQDRRGNLV